MRAILVFAFIALGPGYALLRGLELDRPLRWLLVVTTSLAVTTVIAEALAIDSRWSAPLVLLILGVLTLVGVLLPGRPRGRHR